MSDYISEQQFVEQRRQKFQLDIRRKQRQTQFKNVREIQLEIGQLQRQNRNIAQLDLLLEQHLKAKFIEDEQTVNNMLPAIVELTLEVPPSARRLDFLSENKHFIQKQKLQAYLAQYCQQFPAGLHHIGVQLGISLWKELSSMSQHPDGKLIFALGYLVEQASSSQKEELTQLALSSLANPPSMLWLQVLLELLVECLSQSKSCQRMEQPHALQQLLTIQLQRFPCQVVQAWLKCLINISFNSDVFAHHALHTRGSIWLANLIKNCKQEELKPSVFELLHNFLTARDKRIVQQLLACPQILDIAFLSIQVFNPYSSYIRMLPLVFDRLPTKQLRAILPSFLQSIIENLNSALNLEHGQCLKLALFVLVEKARWMKEPDWLLQMLKQRGVDQLLVQFNMQELINDLKQG